MPSGPATTDSVGACAVPRLAEFGAAVRRAWGCRHASSARPRCGGRSGPGRAAPLGLEVGAVADLAMGDSHVPVRLGRPTLAAPAAGERLSADLAELL